MHVNGVIMRTSDLRFRGEDQRPAGPVKYAQDNALPDAALRTIRSLI
jgi:hypothetical protein